MVHCGIEFQIYQVEFFPVESLDDFADETSLPVVYCPFCGDKI